MNITDEMKAKFQGKNQGISKAKIILLVKKEEDGVTLAVQNWSINL